MVLNQLKGRLKTARRGHKLLKDKRDELMRQFMDVVKENKVLRDRVETGLTGAFASLQVASSIMSPEMLEQALLYPRQSVELDMKFKNIMSVNVPVYSFTTKNNDPSEIYPYGFAQTSGELDDALEKMAKVFEDMLKLAQVEKTMQLLGRICSTVTSSRSRSLKPLSKRAILKRLPIVLPTQWTFQSTRPSTT